MAGSLASFFSTLRDGLRARLSDLIRAIRAEPKLALLALAVFIPSAILFSVTVRSLSAVIIGVHEWRQGETYAVAYAFVHESASFFYPKHAWRGNLTGIVGMEAPVYPYVVSWLMRVFGDAPVVARSANFALFLWAFGLAGKRFGQRIGFAYALGFFAMAAFSPAVLCEFRQVQPDPATASMALLAAICFHDHGQTGARKSFAFGLALYTLSLMTKPIAIAILPAMYLFSVLGDKRPRWLGLLARLAWFALPVALMFAWDKWANYLVQTYMEGNLLISIDHNPETMWREAQDLHMRRFILLGLVENYATHVTLFPAVLLGIPYALRKETRSFGVPFLAWLAGAVVISAAFSSRYYTNWYYMLPFVPPVLFFGAMSLGALFEVIAKNARDLTRVGLALAVVLAGLLVRGLLDDMPWDFVGNIAGNMAVHMRRDVSMSPVYWVAIVFSVLTALGLLQLADLPWRVPHAVLALALTAASAFAMRVPYLDMKQTVRFYTSEVLWQEGRDDTVAVRAAVDRYSTSKDLFVMNGFNPALLVRALRVGWADDPGLIQGVGAAHYVQRGARFFMAFSDGGPPPQTMLYAPVLERGDRWELRCLDPRGCPKL